jgi:hypothetical protein
MSVTKLTKTKNYLEITGFVFVFSLTYICIYPLDYHFTKIISESTVYIMLALFISGFVALYLKFKNALIYSWISCTFLCHHLKDTQKNNFYYTKAETGKTQIKISHFDLKKESDLSNFSEKIINAKSNILSLRLDHELENDSSVINLKNLYPHHFFCDLNKNDKKIRFIFSTFKIDSIETFSWRDESFLLGALDIESASGKLYFMSMSLNEYDPEVMDSSFILLNNFTNTCSKKHIKNQPILVFGDTPYYPWHPEIRTFRDNIMIKDSRLDLELNFNRKHIFYSSHLDCLSFEQVENGVVGIYQFNKATNNTQEIISERN